MFSFSGGGNCQPPPHPPPPPNPPSSAPLHPSQPRDVWPWEEAINIYISVTRDRHDRTREIKALAAIGIKEGSHSSFN